jgi:excisionase family DNA binding protein
MSATDERLLSLEDVANRLQVSDQSVRRWIKAGKLTAYKPGLEWRIRPSDLEDFLQARSYPKVQAPLPESSEERRSALAEVLLVTLEDWQEIVADSPAANTSGGALFAWHIKDRLAVLMSDGERWSQLPPQEQDVITEVMRAVERLDEQWLGRVEVELQRSTEAASVTNLAEVRRQLKQARQSTRRAGSAGA